VELWRRGAADRAHAAQVWSRGLREARALHSGERRLVGDQLMALTRTARGLARALGTADADALWLAALVRAGLPADEAPDLDLRGLPAAFDALGADVASRLRWHHDWPDGLAERLTAELGDEVLAYAVASDARAPLDLRVNLARGPVAAAVAALADEGVQVEVLGGRALRVVVGRGVESTAAFRDGRIEVQDAGSQALGDLVGDEPTTVLDLCAGAGGKSLQLADRGHRVVACDPRTAALDELDRRARRAGVRVERHVGEDGSAPALRGRTFGAVLVDAPCTGTGTWRRHPTLRWTWSPAQEAGMVARQRRLLERAAAFVAPGGRLVYGTCAVARAEDEEVAASFSASHPDFAPGPTLRRWPHRDGTDGFFGAVWTRG
jgi:16S rRNA (cytosine967-C5)-methyltransferase